MNDLAEKDNDSVTNDDVQTAKTTIGDISHRNAVQATKAFFADLREHEDTGHLANALENMDQADRMAMMVRLGIVIDGFFTRGIAEVMDEVVASMSQLSKSAESEESEETGLTNLSKTFD